MHGIKQEVTKAVSLCVKKKKKTKKKKKKTHGVVPKLHLNGFNRIVY